MFFSLRGAQKRITMRCICENGGKSALKNLGSNGADTAMVVDFQNGQALILMLSIGRQKRLRNMVRTEGSQTWICATNRVCAGV